MLKKSDQIQPLSDVPGSPDPQESSNDELMRQFRASGQETGASSSARISTPKSAQLAPREADPILETSPVQRSHEEFKARLPLLLKDGAYVGQWIAFQGSRLIGIFKEHDDAVMTCLQQKVPDEEMYIGIIEEEPEYSLGPGSSF